MAKKRIALILSGGFGSRLWPLSRKKLPKPFIKISKDDSLLSLTYKRVCSLDIFDEIIFVTNQDFFYLTVNEIISIPNKLPTSFILEPLSKNTSPAIAISSLYINEKFGNDTQVLVIPSDHIIANLEPFKKSILNAFELANQNKIVLFGINPTTPDTGFGYIKYQENSVVEFKEKPDLESAVNYLKSGNYLWNSGMFAFDIKTVLNEYQNLNEIDYSKYVDVYSHKIEMIIVDFCTITFNVKLYSYLNKISIDYDLIEKSNNIAIVKGDFDWSDVGSWNEFQNLLDNNGMNNFKNHLFKCSNVKTFSVRPKRIVGIGLKNLKIIDTEDVLFVSYTGQEENFKDVYENLEISDETIISENNIIHRPWGCYKVVHSDPTFLVKSIVVNPHSELSLQKHSMRSEHWTVVRGIATVLNAGKEYNLFPNESTFISQNAVHKLINSQDETLEIIEVQCGTYLSEKDIERLDDKYVRF